MKYRRVMFAAIAVFTLTTRMSAQQFTPEEQQVIDHVRNCWAVWGEEDVDAWLRVCPLDADNRFWWMVESMPQLGPDEARRWADSMFPRIEAMVHFDHRPIDVQIFGDTALYQFWATWTYVDANGQVVTAPERHLDVMQRRGGQWILIGGAAVPEAN